MLCDSLDRKNIEYKWYIIGKAFTDEMDKQIKDMFIGNNKVEFLGYKENPFPYVKQMNYFVLLSDREADPLSVQEALILGIPNIITNFKGANNYINDSNGIILPMDVADYDDYIDRIVNSQYVINKDDYNYNKRLEQWEKLIEE